MIRAMQEEKMAKKKDKKIEEQDVSEIEIEDIGSEAEPEDDPDGFTDEGKK